MARNFRKANKKTGWNTSKSKKVHEKNQASPTKQNKRVKRKIIQENVNPDSLVDFSGSNRLGNQGNQNNQTNQFSLLNSVDSDTATEEFKTMKHRVNPYKGKKNDINKLKKLSYNCKNDGRSRMTRQRNRNSESDSNWGLFDVKFS